MDDFYSLLRAIGTAFLLPILASAGLFLILILVPAILRPPFFIIRKMRSNISPISHPEKVTEANPSELKLSQNLESGKAKIRHSSKRIADQNAPAQITIQPDIPKNYARDLEVGAILDQLRSPDTSPILVTGKAGTGKSTLVRYIQNCGEFPNTVVLAPTGVAAINISGQTLHSFFRLPPRIIDSDALKNQRTNRLWKKVGLIIIDEVSMVRADIIDAIDFILRRERNSNKAFGGCRILFIGDFFQLPPVTPKSEAEMLDKMGYDNPYAYGAKVFEKTTLKRLTLETVHRQNEIQFLEILSNLRTGENLDAAIEQINSRCLGAHRDDVTPVILAGTNATASRYNKVGLSNIDLRPEVYIAKVTGKFDIAKGKLPAPESLELKVGARIIALKNDVNKRWVNGSLGTVTELGSKSAVVAFDNGQMNCDVEISTWENIRYTWDEENNKPVAEVIGSFSQIPLNLAWAVTIHKAQGLTLDDVRIDLESGAFASGQTYVALSRATTLAGLSLSRPLNVSDIIVEKRHLKYFDLVTSFGANDLTELQEPIKTVSPVLPSAKAQVALTILPANLKLIRSKTKSLPLIPIYEIEIFDGDVVKAIPPQFEYFISIKYGDGKNHETTREIKANFVVHASKNDDWYLIGFCFLRNESRSFRMDRIRQVHDKNKDIVVQKDISKYILNLGHKSSSLL